MPYSVACINLLVSIGLDKDCVASEEGFDQP